MKPPKGGADRWIRGTVYIRAMFNRGWTIIDDERNSIPPGVLPDVAPPPVPEPVPVEVVIVEPKKRGRPRKVKEP